MVIIWKQVVWWLLVILYTVICQFMQVRALKTSWKRYCYMNTICCHLISFIIVSSSSLSDLIGWHNVLDNGTCMFKWTTTVMFICLICHVSLYLIFLYLLMQFFYRILFLVKKYAPDVGVVEMFVSLFWVVLCLFLQFYVALWSYSGFFFKWGKMIYQLPENSLTSA